MMTIEMKGLRELELKLLAMSNNISRKITRRAVAAAIKPIKALAEDNAPDGGKNSKTIERSKYPDRKGSQLHPPPGTLKRAIVVVRNQKASKPGKEVYMVIVRRGISAKGNRRFDAYYANFMENKFSSPSTKGIGFMKKAFRDKQAEALRIFEEELEKGIRQNW